MIDYRRATINDIPSISKMVAKSFAHDPAFEYGFKPNIISKSKEEDMFNRLFEVYIKAAMRHQYCLVGEIDNEIISVALIASPTSKKVRLIDYLRSGGISMLPYLNPFKLNNFFAFFDEAKRVCKENVPHGWYVDLLGVSSKHQGKGLGSKIIKECLIPFVHNKQGKAITLITNTELNSRFYLKNGFKLIGKEKTQVNNSPITTWNFVNELASV